MTDTAASPQIPAPHRRAARPAPSQGRGQGGTVSIFTRRQMAVYLALCALWAVAVIWFWVWWLDPSHFVGWPEFLFATIPLAWIHGLQLFFVVVLLQASRTAAAAPVPGQWRVAMVVTKTPSEPFEVVRATLMAMLAQDYPHDTWLADEDPSEETRDWCAQHGVRISSRKGVADYHRATWPRRTRCKEGNLAYFYDHWGYRDYDIVAQLDADHVPQPNYLREMVRPFADPAVGYVSAPSICASNAAESWAARTRLHTEAAFHGLFQTGYTRAFAPMCIGSHYAVRTKALQQVGGLGPELAEDHSTTVMLNSGGWRGVHAIDAIAVGEGPVTFADMITQEFQWSRSVVTLLLTFTVRHIRRMPARLKFLFLFFELWYPLIAITSLLIYLTPILALSFDMRFLDVTYPAFLAHAAACTAVFIIIVFQIRRDGFFRPYRSPALSWEKGLYLAIQWPWILWGCLMAVRDSLTGKFVDFRVTPKGSTERTPLPNKVVVVYAALALCAIVPIFLAGHLVNAAGFVLFSAINAALYTTILLVIVGDDFRRNFVGQRELGARRAFHVVTTLIVVGVLALALSQRGTEGLLALIYGLEPFRLVKAEFGVAGAGVRPEIFLYWDPGWRK